MKEMEEIPMDEFLDVLRQILLDGLSKDHVSALCYCDEFVNDVKQNVEQTSAWGDEGYYNDDDVKLAVGRIICDKFGAWL